MKAGILIVLCIALLVIIVYLIASSGGMDGTKTESPVASTEATLSDRLIFPVGYHLAEAYSYAFQVSGPYVVYICQRDDDPEDYRICTPKVEKVGDQ